MSKHTPEMKNEKHPVGGYTVGCTSVPEYGIGNPVNEQLIPPQNRDANT
jgi:hypothetical protein